MGGCASPSPASAPTSETTPERAGSRGDHWSDGWARRPSRSPEGVLSVGQAALGVRLPAHGLRLGDRGRVDLPLSKVVHRATDALAVDPVPSPRRSGVSGPAFGMLLLLCVCAGAQMTRRLEVQREVRQMSRSMTGPSELIAAFSHVRGFVPDGSLALAAAEYGPLARADQEDEARDTRQATQPPDTPLRPDRTSPASCSRCPVSRGRGNWWPLAAGTRRWRHEADDRRRPGRADGHLP